MNTGASRDSLVRRLHAPVRRARTKERERGQGMVEYALILMLMALVVIVVLSVVGAQTNNVFSNISNGLTV